MQGFAHLPGHFAVGLFRSFIEKMIFAWSYEANFGNRNVTDLFSLCRKEEPPQDEPVNASAAFTSASTPSADLLLDESPCVTGSLSN